MIRNIYHLFLKKSSVSVRRKIMIHLTINIRISTNYKNLLGIMITLFYHNYKILVLWS